MLPPVKLTNFPRSDLPRRNADRGVHIYPFHDPKLKGKYGQLPLPTVANASPGEILHPALKPKKTWFDVKVTNFNSGSGRGTMQRWPFGKTTVEQTKGRMPSGQGTVYMDDLGGVQEVLEEANVPIKTDVANANKDDAPPKKANTKKPDVAKKPDPFPTVLAPEITGTRTRTYKLEPSAKLKKVLSDWHECVVITKNEAIRRVNLVQDYKALSDFQLKRDLVNNTSDFVREQDRDLKHSMTNCPVQPRRQAIVEAVAARKSLLTRAGKTDKLFDIKPVETSTGFELAFAKTCGSIAFVTNGNKRPKVSKNGSKRRKDGKDSSRGGVVDPDRFANPWLVMTPMKLKEVKVSPYVEMRVRGNKNRQELYDLLKGDKGQDNGDGGDKKDDEDSDDKDEDKAVDSASPANELEERLQLPREWRIVRNSQGYWLTIAFKVDKTQPKVKTVFQSEMAVTGIDPGARTMLTAFESVGRTVEIGSKEDAARLAAMRVKADKLKGRRMEKVGDRPDNKKDDDQDKSISDKDDSQDAKDMSVDKKGKGKARDDEDKPVDTVASTPGEDDSEGDKRPFVLPAKQRRRLLKVEKRILAHHRNLVTDLHRRAANYFATTANVVVMPRMETRGMIRGRRLNKKVKRTLMAYRHCEFADRLYIKAHDVQHDKRYNKHQSMLLAQPEAYTSKTCAKCGHLNDKLGAKEVFECSQPDCDYVAGRDHNGAVNMILRAIR
ncbi:Transposase IS605, OrfB, C-terminal [Kalmanozyma brasiliensis GHG001]|uniref:Cas12f1-like TNB domain-containing protein n=1 Tax=Kalmanozyma brasiliensis (strain GHG001) TaxID=1365824 RepID=V5EFT7_KALBG|nr:Transposase IS605, OrfB, C-terminal [Kalmanozyma brasiliensis GHG001]EST09391.1 Transposase IS605, OrfB, C-terminal [Kalmanozyma brasiliensis GHG001]